MISIDEVLEIHKIPIHEFGGTHGIRDINALESALCRPMQQFEKKDLYPSTLHKAAALVQSLLANHPFLDGNKRVGYTLLRYFLLQNGLDMQATQEEKYDFIIGIATGSADYESIVEWLEKHNTTIG